MRSIVLGAKFLAKQSLSFLFYILSMGKRIAPFRVLGGPAKGAILNLDLRSQGSYWLGNYDAYAMDRIPFDRYVKPGTVAWDCGAFVGYYTAIFRRCIGADGQVITFEASSANYAQVKVVPKLNSWDNVNIIHGAVGAAHTTIRFAHEEGAASGPIGLQPGLIESPTLASEEVECFGSDQLILEQGIPRPSFVKFDLEGAEIFALKNGPVLFGQVRPVLMLELHGEPARAAAKAFMDEHRYYGVMVHDFGLLRDCEERAWLAQLRSSCLRTGEDLAKVSYLPHMIMMFPEEHPDVAEPSRP